MKDISYMPLEFFYTRTRSYNIGVINAMATTDWQLIKMKYAFHKNSTVFVACTIS